MSYYSTDNRIVTHARVVAHLSQDLGGGVSENHWSVYLLLEDETSIRMNMAAGDDGIGRLEFTPYNYQLTTSALRHWDYAMVAGVPVSYIYTMTYNFGRDRYQFSGGGSGCRYWCYTIISDLEQQRYVEEGSLEQLWTHLGYRYSRSREPRELNWVQGEVY